MLHLINAEAKKINKEAQMMQEIIFPMSATHTILMGLDAGRDIVNPGSVSHSTRKMTQGFDPVCSNVYWSDRIEYLQLV